jgi:hypothetical protein
VTSRASIRQSPLALRQHSLTATFSQTSAPPNKGWIVGVTIVVLLTGALVVVVVVIWKNKHSGYTKLERSELTEPLDKT